MRYFLLIIIAALLLFGCAKRPVDPRCNQTPMTAEAAMWQFKECPIKPQRYKPPDTYEVKRTGKDTFTIKKK